MSMEFERAKRVLGSYRLGEDVPPGSELAQALEWAARDPALSAWLREELAMDMAIRQRLRSLPPPVGLRERLLAVPKVVPMPAWHRWRSALAAAAMVALSTVGAWWLLTDREGGRPGTIWSDRPSSNEFRREMATFLSEGQYRLQFQGSSLNDVMEYLAGQGIARIEVPGGLEALRTYGCQVFSWRQREVVLICFRTDDMGIAHLLVFADERFAGGPDVEVRTDRAGDWTTAEWSRDGQSFILLARGSAERVRRIVGS